VQTWKKTWHCTCFVHIHILQMNRNYKLITRGTAGTSFTKARPAICCAQMRPVVAQWHKSTGAGYLN
jgi:hypothetical protein